MSDDIDRAAETARVLRELAEDIEDGDLEPTSVEMKNHLAERFKHGRIIDHKVTGHDFKLTVRRDE